MIALSILGVAVVTPKISWDALSESPSEGYLDLGARLTNQMLRVCQAAKNSSEDCRRRRSHG